MTPPVADDQHDAVKAHFQQSHFEVDWPPDLLRDELRALMLPEARLDEVKILLSEIFRFEDPLSEYEPLREASPWRPMADPSDYAHWSSKREWLRDLWRYANVLPRPEERAPYWSQRTADGERKRFDLGQVMKKWVDLITELGNRGYLVDAFGQECVDDPEGSIGRLGSEPVSEIDRMLDKERLWHPVDHWHRYEEEDFYDVVELVSDIVARPRSGRYHDYAGCGWHYAKFARGPGLSLYRHRVNELFAKSTLSLTLGENGRLEVTSGGELENLVRQVRAPRGDDDPVATATRQFRQREANEETKRQAINSLAGVLEGRRSLLKDRLLRKDEGSLFQVANEFDLRHRRADQRVDYDKNLYFEWIFYWYLSTISLTDGLLGRQIESQSTPDAAPF